MTPGQRAEALASRVKEHRSWHRPPHRYHEGRQHYHLTGACYEHRPHIGFSETRMDEFSACWLEALQEAEAKVCAWCVLPNHYHALIEASLIAKVLSAMGRFHGRVSHAWNGEEGSVGRQNFHGAVERTIRSDAHYLTTLNYVHHNPVRHGYVAKWTDWPWSSASSYLESQGREAAEAIWRQYPVLDYGAGWDDAAL